MEYLNQLTLDQLTPMVRTLRQSTEVTATSWDKVQLTSGQSGSPVYRITGTALDKGTTFNWSLILKYCTNIDGWGHVYAVDDPAWQREILVYQSGLLDGISGSLRPPRFIASSQQAPTEIALFLEDVGTDWSEKWSIERYATAAYHLGQFNAHYAGRPPTVPWLGREQWRKYLRGACREGIDSLAEHQDHPEVLAVYPKPIQEQLFALRDDADALANKAYALSPLTLCHGDPGGRNLYHYEGCTVAIDWFDASIAPLGEEVARMVGSSIHWFFRGQMDQAPTLADSAIEQYIAGLLAAGWNGNADVVRFTFRAALATMYGLSYTGRAGNIVRGEIEAYASGPYQTTADKLLRHVGEMARFFLTQADAARALGDK
jgi:hypothetical protein